MIKVKLAGDMEPSGTKYVNLNDGQWFISEDDSPHEDGSPDIHNPNVWHMKTDNGTATNIYGVTVEFNDLDVVYPIEILITEVRNTHV